MKKIYQIVLVLMLFGSFFACSKEEELKVLGSVYGTITDKNTGKPIQEAMVGLRPVGVQKRTGSTGKYEFYEIEAGSYSLYVTKSGYKDYEKDSLLIQGNSKDKPVDVQLEKLPPALTIVDESGRALDMLDFDSEEITQKAFGIFNDSEDNLEWTIVQPECKWIKSFSKDTGTLSPNQTQSVVCTIDRNKLQIGKDSTIVHIVSNNGSKELKVVATSIDVIETLAISEEDIGSHTAIFHGRVARNLDPLITEYGFVYSTRETPTLTNGAQKISNLGSPQIGEYEMQTMDLEKETKYYVCAFVTNGEKTYYGSQISFSTISHIPHIRLFDDSPSISFSYRPKSTAKTITVTYTVDDDGGLPLEEVGICWNTNRLPTLEDQYLKTGDKKESFKKVTITNLLPSTTYYLRAYVRNGEEENYSAEISVLTTGGKLIAATISTDSKGKDYLIISGSSFSSEDISIIRQGICYSNNNSSPTIYDRYVDAENLSAKFTCNLTGLNGCTTYHCRAYAINEYNTIAYGEIIDPTTLCDPTTLKGFVYDQDGKPIQGATVGIGKSDGTYDNSYSSYSTITNSEGYYEMTFNIETSTSWYILVTKDGFIGQSKNILINPEQIHSLDFNLSLVTTFDIDLGTGFWANGPSHLLFECSQSTLSGKTTQRNIRIKNYRSVPVSYNFSNVPSVGIKFSNISGTIPANKEISITATFTYPSTTNSQVVSLPYCSTAHRAYLWNWEKVVVGQYICAYTMVSYTDNKTPVGVSYEVTPCACCSCCQQNIFITVGDVQAGFTLTFNQFVTY